ncbi:hypothetical protein DAPK24_002170 [Pichia kluyveri]|uniref:RRM domain-containing protein n=1 Tax=Pichia kluyveri TaxID=36015 RepID=A0AAV5QXV5_PICKL|nr:hypothetical protein DAPK24_002170 [Pichia kluyveri]
MNSIQIAGASRPYTREHAPVSKSVEGYILIITNLHPETTEDNLYEIFEEYCKISNIHLNNDKQTGFIKGYAFIEIVELDECIELFKIHETEPFEIFGNKLNIDYAFVTNDVNDRKSRSRNGNIDNNDRDLSPIRH